MTKAPRCEQCNGPCAYGPKLWSVADHDIRQAVFKEAEKEGRSVSNFIAVVLQKEFIRRGLLPSRAN